MSDNPNADNEAMEELYAAVVSQLKNGESKTAVVQTLVDGGANQTESQHLVDTIHKDLRQIAEEEEFSGEVIVPAAAGGLVASIAGGVVWGEIVINTGYEIGFVAWGIGWLSGMAVVKLAQGKKGMPLQVLAVVSSVLGILVGKYLTFFHVFKEMLEGQGNAEAAASLSVFSMGFIRFFFENLGNMAGGYDILWIVLAVWTAWSIPKSSGIKLSKT